MVLSARMCRERRSGCLGRRKGPEICTPEKDRVCATAYGRFQEFIIGRISTRGDQLGVGDVFGRGQELCEPLLPGTSDCVREGDLELRLMARRIAMMRQH